jgi:predicted HicB family RNase H-like nuclease
MARDLRRNVRSVRLPAELWEALIARAARAGRSVNDLIHQAIRDMLGREP